MAASKDSSNHEFLLQLYEALWDEKTSITTRIAQNAPIWTDITNETILELGGWQNGALMAALLREYPSMHSAVYAPSQFIEVIHSSFHGVNGEYADVGHRVAQEHVYTGDFLRPLPSFAVYLLVGDGWRGNDAEALVALRRVRSGIRQGPSSRLILLVSLLPGLKKENARKHWLHLAEMVGWELTGEYSLRNAWISVLDLRSGHSR